MRRSIAHATVSRLICIVALLASASAQNVRPVPDGDLSLRIIPAVTGLKGSESLLIKVEVTNVGNNPVLIRADDLCLNPGAGLSLSVRDSAGHPLKTTVPLSCVPSTGPNDRDAFIHLAPDAFYGRFIRMEASRVAPKPGTYELTFTLRGTMSRREVGVAIGTTPAPVTAFTSNSAPLVFKLSIQLAK